MKKEILLNDIRVLKQCFKDDPSKEILRRALFKSDISALNLNTDALIEDNYVFNIEVPTMRVTNQNSSGRCWLFAGLNLLREKVAKRLNLSNFELSQNYLAYCDKLEKANFFMENIINYIDRDIDDRTFSLLKAMPVQDGGQWDMFVSLVKKYGVMPKQCFPETFASDHTASINKLLNSRLRTFAKDAKNLFNSHRINEINSLKEECFKDVFNIVNACFGVPPEVFDFEYYDKEGIVHSERKLTPKAFYDKYVGINLDDYVSIINAPTKDKPFYKTYTVEALGNVYGGKKIHYLNLPMDEVNELIIKQLKDNELVWFGSDVSKYGERIQSIWDDKYVDPVSLFNVNIDLDKEHSLDYGESQMNHAMIICGVHIVDNKPLRWKIENSWGEDNKQYNGFYIMSNTWFDRFTFQAVINKKYLNEKQLSANNLEEIVLKPWDPMGTLAD